MTAQAFEAVLVNYGMTLKTPVQPDGEIHRCHVQGDRAGTLNGWYVLNMDGNRSWGTYMRWGREVRTWRGSRNDASRTHSTSPAKPVRWKWHGTTLAERWATCCPADPQHPYLVRKRVGVFGIRQTKAHKAKLIVPVRTIDGELVGLQLIENNGDKRFYSGSQKKGNMHVIGDWGNKILIAEGYATAASCFMTLNHCAVVAFDCGNMVHVGKVIRRAHPYVQLFYMADSDPAGIAAAKHAARETGGMVLNPLDYIDENSSE